MGTTDLYYFIDIPYYERKPGPTLTLLVSFTAGRQEGRSADEMWVGFEIIKILYRLNYSGFILLNITTMYHIATYLVKSIVFSRISS